MKKEKEKKKVKSKKQEKGKVEKEKGKEKDKKKDKKSESPKHQQGEMLRSVVVFYCFVSTQAELMFEHNRIRYVS